MSDIGLRNAVTASGTLVENMTLIFSVDDERPDWAGYRLDVYRDGEGAIHVYQRGSRGGLYPQYSTTKVPREEIPALIGALARSLVER